MAIIDVASRGRRMSDDRDARKRHGYKD